jgi:hypothetical protein
MYVPPEKCRLYSREQFSHSNKVKNLYKSLNLILEEKFHNMVLTCPSN